MNLHILTHSIPSNFWRALDKSKDYGVIHHEGETLAQVLKVITSADFFYWEPPTEESEFKKGMKLLGKNHELHWGILDPLGLIHDVAELFFTGACDYLGPILFSEPLTTARFKKMCLWGVNYSHREKEEPSAFDWKDLISGQEYPFFFLLVSLSDTEVLKKRFGENRFNQLKSEFKVWLTRAAQEEGGQLWMDMETSFLVLFPDQPQPSPMIFGFKTLLNRLHLGFEYFRMEQPLDLVLAAHVGKATWRPPGQTGTVVSDAVNSVFHLGQKYAAENTFSLTEECLPHVPKSFKDLLVPQGGYEGRQIYRFKKSLFCWADGRC